MAEPFLGEIKIMGFNFPPVGWAMCNGQILPLSQNTALFSLLGTTYGGNGTSNFALPNLQGNVPLHRSGDFPQGATGGETTHTLNISELGAHSHPMMGVASPNGTQRTITGNLPGATNANLYSTTPSGLMDPNAVTPSVSGGQPHNNLQPYLVLNFCIALQGVFPARG
jgi:microcystin-dependent protein